MQLKSLVSHRSKSPTTMAKAKTQYRCSECSALHPKWGGQCGDCDAWNTLEEETTQSTTEKSSSRFAGYAGEISIETLANITPENSPRIASGITELDRVLGGGIVPGSVVLIGGDPGIGKSTLLLQVVAQLDSKNCLYVSGEESSTQISMRAQRLELDCPDLRLLTETCTEKIISLALIKPPRYMIIDSIQTLYTENSSSSPGSVTQVRESTAQLVRMAKQRNICLFIVGHVTKEGTLAGPRVLEHMVDTVLYFEGDPNSRYRVLRAVKNRFGAVNELGIFAMDDSGLKPVSNPSAIFLSRHETPVSGSTVMVTHEGNRPMLVEVQALVTECHSNHPRRLTQGLDQNRLAMLLAILQRHGGVSTYDQDVFVNVVGGVKIAETAADLPVVLAILSSLRDAPMTNGLIAFGELGLAGEVRPIPNGQERLKEAAKHGFTKAIVPAANAKIATPKGLEVIKVKRLQDCLEHLTS